MSQALPCDGSGRRALEEIQAAHPEATDGWVARVCGVDASLVSRWRSGERAMPVWALAKLIKKTMDASTALGDLASIAGCEIVKVPGAAGGGRDLLRQAAGLSGSVGRLAADVADATDPESDGGEALTGGERAGLVAEIDAAMARLAQLKADVQARPRAVA